MTIALAGRGVRVVLLDIEGTTSPIAFVHERLFPYAYARLGRWLAAHAGTDRRRDIIATLRAEHAADVARGEDVPRWPSGDAGGDAPAVAYLEWLMRRDRKSPALKELQGLIWEDGYQAGDLHGEVFEDVPAALRRWRAAGVAIAIYSSGSELAQRRLFASLPAGDLTPLISAFFDTRVGAKTAAASYARIAAALGRAAGDVLFVSDAAAELRAAAEAGCQVLLSRRPGNAPQPDAAHVDAIDRFDDLV